MKNEVVLCAESLLHNVSVIKKASIDSNVVAVVKGNAYGHGMLEICEKLNECDEIAMFGVSSLDEAITLRKQNQYRLSKGILVMSYEFDSEDSLIMAADESFEVVLYNEEQVKLIESIEQKRVLKTPLNVWFKLDTGMGRLGFAPDRAHLNYNRLLACTKSVSSVSIMSHLACADVEGHDANDTQMMCFKKFLKKINVHTNTKVSIYNSAGLFSASSRNDGTFLGNKNNYVRVGISLYGISPFSDISANVLDLKPVMTLKSFIISIHTVKKGSTVGYGARYICDRDTKVGVASIGYYNGYPYYMQDGAPVLVNGSIYPLIGKVSMNMITINLNGSDLVCVGDEVILFGSELPLEVVAMYTDNAEIPYSIVTSLQKDSFCYRWK